LVAQNAIQLPLNTVKKMYLLRAAVCQFALQNNEAYFEGYLEFLRYSEISIYLFLSAPLTVYCGILTMQYKDNLFFPTWRCTTTTKLTHGIAICEPSVKQNEANVRNKYLHHRAAICKVSLQEGAVVST
jgi:hypothetical protein